MPEKLLSPQLAQAVLQYGGVAAFAILSMLFILYKLIEKGAVPGKKESFWIYSAIAFCVWSVAVLTIIWTNPSPFGQPPRTVVHLTAKDPTGKIVNSLELTFSRPCVSSQIGNSWDIFPMDTNRAKPLTIIASTKNDLSGEVAVDFSGSEDVQKTIELAEGPEVDVIGTVYNEESQASIRGATISISGSPISSLSKENGSFILPKAGQRNHSFSVDVRCSGFKPYQGPGRIGDTLNIYLSPVKHEN